MRKIKLLAATLALSGAMLIAGAPNAGATTCIIMDGDEIEGVVCVVYTTVGTFVCKPLEKFGGCTQ